MSERSCAAVEHGLVRCGKGGLDGACVASQELGEKSRNQLSADA
jgi:hypothetical protein